LLLLFSLKDLYSIMSLNTHLILNDHNLFIVFLQV